MIDNKYLVVYTDLIPANGPKRAAFHDVSRRDIVFFPARYFPMLALFKKHNLEELMELNCENFSERDKLSFISFLIKHELAFKSLTPENFPPIKKQIEKPSLLHNAIIDIDHTLHDLKALFKQFSDAGCEYLQLRGFSTQLSPAVLSDALVTLVNTTITSIEVLLKYDPTYSKKDYEELLANHPDISSLLVHSSPWSLKRPVRPIDCPELSDHIDRDVVFVTRTMNSAKDCGRITVGALTPPTTYSVMECISHNGCLNQKASIDIDGNIKNCPSMKNSFGHYTKYKVADIAAKTDFQEIWHINKDQINVCNKCELRYSCSGCSVYTDDGTPYSKPSKCNYDPNTAAWKDNVVSIDVVMS